MRLGSVTVNPKPGWMPSLTKLAENRASGAPTRKSGGEGEAEPAPDGRPLHGRNHRRLRGEQPHALSIKHARGISEAILGELLVAGSLLAARAEVRPGTEGLAVGGEHDGSTRRIVVAFGVGIGDLRDQVAIEEVVRRPVDLHRGDVTVHTHVDVRKIAGHDLPLMRKGRRMVADTQLGNRT